MNAKANNANIQINNSIVFFLRDLFISVLFNRTADFSFSNIILYPNTLS